MFSLTLAIRPKSFSANYEHLEDLKLKNKNKSEADINAQGDGKFSSTVDISEHMLSFQELTTRLDTSFYVKDPSKSLGLTPTVAEQRLAQNGPNVLTPPKKRSAFEKVDVHLSLSEYRLTPFIFPVS